MPQKNFLNILFQNNADMVAEFWYCMGLQQSLFHDVMAAYKVHVQ